MAGVGLLLWEREEIRVGIEGDESLARIGRRLGRSPSTVCREVARNGGREAYRAAKADRRARRQRRRPKVPKLVADSELAAHVTRRLKTDKASPQTIFRDLIGQGAEATVSHETIYRAVYAHGKEGLEKGLHVHLHRRRRCRKRRRMPNQPPKASPLGAFRPIRLRPAGVAERVEAGHWEGDLIIGANNRSAVVTLIERVSRYNLLGDLPEGATADCVLACLVELCQRIPEGLRRTLTWDQGREMARWAHLEAAVGVDVYFADPHSPWQRPVNENFNGLARRWLPKGTDLSVHTQDDLDHISRNINTIPRRSLNWDTATDRYHALVATTA